MPPMPSKVIRTVFPAAETGFDPAGVQDLYSATIEQMLFETLLTYDYPPTGEARSADSGQADVEVSDNGKTYTVRVRKGIYFIDDPAFKGRKRELTAADYAYALKRLIDPKIHSPWAWLVEGKVIGRTSLPRPLSKKPAPSTTMRRVAGLESPTATRCASGSSIPTTTCRNSSRTQLTSAVAREVIEAYRDEVDARCEPRRHRRIYAEAVGTELEDVLEANPWPSRVPVTLHFKSSGLSDLKSQVNPR